MKLTLLYSASTGNLGHSVMGGSSFKACLISGVGLSLKDSFLVIPALGGALGVLVNLAGLVSSS